MRRSLGPQLLRVPFWGILTLTALVCALGMQLTASQYRDLRAILLEAAKSSTARKAAELGAFLEEDLRRALQDLLEAEDDPARLRALASRFPYMESPFLVSVSGTVSAPLLRRRLEPPPLLADEVPPERCEQTLRLAHSAAPLARRRAALEELAGAGDVEEEWRLRARVHLAGLLAREGDVEGAARTYEEVFAEHGRLLAASAAPSLLHVTLASSETLLAASRPAEAARRLTGALRRLLDGELPLSLAAEQYFVERAELLLASCPGPAPAELAAARARLDSERLTRMVLDALRDWIETHSRLAAPPQSRLEPQYFFARLAGHLVPAVWSPVPPAAPSGAAPMAVGFQLSEEGLRRQLAGRLERLHGEALVILAGRRQTVADPVVLASLPGELDFVHIAMERPAWERVVGDKRGPFLFAGALIGALGALLLLGLVLLARGVRREIALSRLKTEFVANVSHELKTPLALIRLCTETLQLERIPRGPQRERYYQVIGREIERLSHLISNVLNFANIEAGRKTYRLEVLDLSPVLRETLQSYRFQLEEKGFEVHWEVPEKLPPVLADGEAVIQALVNLLENAVKYSPESRWIEVTARAEGGHLRISVADRGVGVAPAEQERIWDDYYRSPEARALGTRGSGLGLSLVRHIVDAHGGRVELESAPGRGSRFTLVLPLAGPTGSTLPDERSGRSPHPPAGPAVGEPESARPQDTTRGTNTEVNHEGQGAGDRG